MTPIDMAKQLLVNAKDHPMTTAFAMVAIAMLGGGRVMTENQIEPWGTALSGLGAIVVIVLGMFSHDPPKTPPAPPTAPPTVVPGP